MEELAPASLRNGASEKELQAVFGEQGLLVLTSEDAVPLVPPGAPAPRPAVVSPVCGAILRFRLRVSARRGAAFSWRRAPPLALPLTFAHAPVVASHRVSTEMFCARFSQLMATLVPVAHFTMVT